MQNATTNNLSTLPDDNLLPLLASFLHRQDICHLFSLNRYLYQKANNIEQLTNITRNAPSQSRNYKKMRGHYNLFCPDENNSNHFIHCMGLHGDRLIVFSSDSRIPNSNYLSEYTIHSNGTNASLVRRFLLNCSMFYNYSVLTLNRHDLAILNHHAITIVKSSFGAAIGVFNLKRRIALDPGYLLAVHPVRLDDRGQLSPVGCYSNGETLWVMTLQKVIIQYSFNSTTLALSYVSHHNVRHLNRVTDYIVSNDKLTLLLENGEIYQEDKTAAGVDLKLIRTVDHAQQLATIPDSDAILIRTSPPVEFRLKGWYVARWTHYPIKILNCDTHQLQDVKYETWKLWQESFIYDHNLWNYILCSPTGNLIVTSTRFCGSTFFTRNSCPITYCAFEFSDQQAHNGPSHELKT